MKELFLGSYWGPRQEGREECALMLSRFLDSASVIDPALKRWFLPARRKKDALTPIDTSPHGVETLLRTNNRDTDGEPIAKLGLSLGLWNGKSGSFSAYVGSFSPAVGNSIVLSLDSAGEVPSDPAVWRALIELSVTIFDPDVAVVTNREYIDRHGGGPAREAGGWFEYTRGEQVIERAFPWRVSRPVGEVHDR